MKLTLEKEVKYDQMSNVTIKTTERRRSGVFTRIYNVDFDQLNVCRVLLTFSRNFENT